MKAALPRYFPAGFGSAPPGHRFRLYFVGWKDGDGWEGAEKEKKKSLEGVIELGSHVRPLDEWRKRQLSLALQRGERVRIFSAKARSPFVTGMGLEHPLENGFAFLDPYGLPYLPGSSVKGVVRHAAEELALFDSEASGWTLDAVWWLFGFDATSSCFEKPTGSDPWPAAYRKWCANADEDSICKFVETSLPAEQSRHWKGKPAGFLLALAESEALRRSIHTRGSLRFWDALPKPPNNRLRIDLMNPHYGRYYQGKNGEWPGDWGNPNPIVFLALPEGSEFRFIVELDPAPTLPQELKSGKWRQLVESAMAHAFEWLGFGGKTSQGYGLFQADKDDEKGIEEYARREGQQREEAEQKRRQQEKKRQLEFLSPLERMAAELEQAGEERVHEIYRQLGQYEGEEKVRLAQALRRAYQRLNKWSGKIGPRQKEKVSELKRILGERS